MDPVEIEGVLGRADRAEDLPRLGGMARPDGVVIVSERFWAFAGRDGELVEGAMPSGPARLRRVPLIRGLVRLGTALAPLVSGRRVAGRREKAVLVGALLLPAAFAFLPEAADEPAGIALTVALLCWIFRGRTRPLHGAEHRAIAAAEGRVLLGSWAGAAKPSRFALRCGTNFAALVLPITFAATVLWPLGPAAYTPVAIPLVSLALTMELWQAVQALPARIGRPFLAPGLALQRLTTGEPALEDTRVALHALASVLRREAAAT